MVSGRRRNELKAEQVYESYAQRYGIEHCFRFGKQKLLLARSQTPDTRHEEKLTWATMLSLATGIEVTFLKKQIAPKLQDLTSYSKEATHVNVTHSRDVIEALRRDPRILCLPNSRYSEHVYCRAKPDE